MLHNSTIILESIIVFVIILATFVSKSHEAGDENWNYTNQQDWSKEYPLCAGKRMRQSPIDIVLDDVIQNNFLTLKFIDYDQELTQEARNTGHSVKIVAEEDKNTCDHQKGRQTKTLPKVKLNWLPFLFELNDIHFHWGDSKTYGSEHKVNGKRAAAEMHMVHIRKGVKEDDIGKVEDSVVVVGVFIEIGKHTNTGLELLIEQAARVNGTDTSFVGHNGWIENVKNLLPANDHKFYTYQGSLTTPPCYEVVTWIVMSAPITVTLSRLQDLTNLAVKDSQGLHRISKNFRYTQPLLDRPVYASDNIREVVSNALVEQTKSKNPDFGVSKKDKNTSHFQKQIVGPFSGSIGRILNLKPNMLPYLSN